MNVILVMSDTFRYDNLSCYGPTPVKTPRLDEFSGRAFVFDNARPFPTAWISRAAGSAALTITGARCPKKR
jgi:arylsulfatase A-like enzyme